MMIVHNYIFGLFVATPAEKDYPPGNQHSPFKGTFEDYFPFRMVGYVGSLEGIDISKFMRHGFKLARSFLKATPV